MCKKKKKSQEKLQKPLELDLKGKPNRERLPSLLLDLPVEFSLFSGLKFGVCEDVCTGSMCPKSLGQAIMGGLRVPGAVSSEIWPCEKKGGFVSSKVRGFQMEQNLKGKHEHGGVAGVPVTLMRPGLNTGPRSEVLRGKEVREKKPTQKKTDCTCQILQVFGMRVFMALPSGKNVCRPM